MMTPIASMSELHAHLRAVVLSPPMAKRSALPHVLFVGPREYEAVRLLRSSPTQLAAYRRRDPGVLALVHPLVLGEQLLLTARGTAASPQLARFGAAIKRWLHDAEPTRTGHDGQVLLVSLSLRFKWDESLDRLDPLAPNELAKLARGLRRMNRTTSRTRADIARYLLEPMAEQAFRLGTSCVGFTDAGTECSHPLLAGYRELTRNAPEEV
jgi:hypothetical protein